MQNVKTDIQVSLASFLPELHLVWFREIKEGLEVIMSYNRQKVPCPFCRSLFTMEHDRKAQRKRDCNFGHRKVFIILSKRRFRCYGCGEIFTEPDELFGCGKRSSKRFRQYLREQAMRKAIKQVAREESVSENMVRRCLSEVN